MASTELAKPSTVKARNRRKPGYDGADAVQMGPGKPIVGIQGIAG
ncbi:hypothetical protein [Bradyrhizobium sp.]|nr:hypothetical protein [Bradyrhizobium sp.]